VFNPIVFTSSHLCVDSAWPEAIAKLVLWPLFRASLLRQQLWTGGGGEAVVLELVVMRPLWPLVVVQNPSAFYSAAHEYYHVRAGPASSSPALRLHLKPLIVS
jgi:hypothetical protein